jgi:hypothetical protein
MTLSRVLVVRGGRTGAEPRLPEGHMEIVSFYARLILFFN